MADITIRPLTGMESQLPQTEQAATEIVNMTIDPDHGGWSSKIGYEPYRANYSVGYAPFSALGRIDSLFVANSQVSGSRETILLESGGSLYLLHEYGKPTVSLVGLLASRSIPTSGQSPTSYTETPHGIVLTNGQDHPVLIRPWSVGTASDVSTRATLYSRPLGFRHTPSAPDLGRVIPASSVSSGEAQTEDAITYWWPTKPVSIGQHGDWGLGYSKNENTVPDRASLYAYSVSFISGTGS